MFYIILPVERLWHKYQVVFGWNLEDKMEQNDLVSVLTDGKKIEDCLYTNVVQPWG